MPKIKVKKRVQDRLEAKDLPANIQKSVQLVKNDIIEVHETATEYEISLKETVLAASVFKNLLRNSDFQGIKVKDARVVLLFFK